MTFDRWQETSVTRDHIKPKAFGGSDNWENLVAACHKCNQLRGTMDAERFHYLLVCGKLRKLYKEARFKKLHFEHRALKKAKESAEDAWAYIDRMKRLGIQT